MASHPKTALVIREPDPLPPELQARPGPHPTLERRLRVDVERVWPMLAGAVRQAGGVRLLRGIAEALFELGSVVRPVGDHRRAAEGRRAIAEEQLAPLMAQRGLSLKLACATAGVSLQRVKEWQREDPNFAARLDGYRRQGLAALHGTMHTLGVGGSESAIAFLLKTSGEEEYVDRLKVGDLDEDAVTRSKAWGRLTTRLMGALGPGHACSSCGGCECRSAVAEELGR